MVQFSPFQLGGHVSKIKFFPTDVKKTYRFLRESEGKKKSVGFWGVKSTKDYVHRLENCKRSRIFCCCSSWCLLTYFLLHSSVFFLSLYLCRFSKNVWAQVNNFKTLHRAQVSILFKVQLENNLSLTYLKWISIWRLQKLLHCRLTRLKRIEKSISSSNAFWKNTDVWFTAKRKYFLRQ